VWAKDHGYTGEENCWRKHAYWLIGLFVTKFPPVSDIARESVAILQRMGLRSWNKRWSGKNESATAEPQLMLAAFCPHSTAGASRPSFRAYAGLEVRRAV